MPWKETDVTDERLKLIAAWQEEEYGSFTELCEVFGVSRTASYKLVERYQAEGLDGLKDKSRAQVARGFKTSVPRADHR